MSDTQVTSAVSAPPTIHSLPLIMVLFVGSGCAALIYEVVWFQLLSLSIGSSAISLGIILGTFMGGMCLGSLIFPRLAPANWHPLRVYAFLELGIGLFGIIVLLGVPLISRLYTDWAGSEAMSMFLRVIVALLFLLPPSLLMGATLPAISRWVKMTPRGVSWLGFFYGGNTAGAVIGSLLAGFFLLRLYDMTTATFVAVVINATVAAIGLTLAKVSPFSAIDSTTDGDSTNEKSSSRWIVYLVIGLSGMTALAAEVIWTRLLSLSFGATVYTFSIILSVFLLGLGIGSSAASAIIRNITRPRLGLAVCQILLSLAMGWSIYELMASIPFWPIDPYLSVSPWIKIKMDVVRTLWAVSPSALLWGASFPFALAAVAKPGQDSGYQVGSIYAANTAGAIIGSLGASLILIAWIGSQRSQQLLIGLVLFSGLLALGLALSHTSFRSRLKISGVVLPIIIVCSLIIVNVPELPKQLIAYGRYSVTSYRPSVDVIYIGEGLTASIAVSKTKAGTLSYHNAGRVQASGEPADMRLQRMLGHLTTLIPDNPRRFLVIGCGAGVTAGAISIEPKLEKLTIVEIERLSPEIASEYFGQHNFDVINNPKTEVVIDDGRHYLFTSDEKFDGISTDPLDPWVKGSAALYTKEFFEAAKEHLNPGGVVTQYVPLYENSEAAVKSQIATFFEVFPYGSIWVNVYNNAGWDLVLLGQLEPTRIDIDELSARINTTEYSEVAASLSEVGFSSVLELLATFGGQASDFQPWLQGASINRDRNLRLQYLAGLGLNLSEAYNIYIEMLSHGPELSEEMFIGSDPQLDILRKAIKSGQFR